MINDLIIHMHKTVVSSFLSHLSTTIEILTVYFFGGIAAVADSARVPGLMRLDAARESILFSILDQPQKSRFSLECAC